MDFKKLLTVFTVVFTVVVGTSGYLTSGFGLISKIDGRYAKAGELKQLSLRVQWISSQVRLNYLRQLKAEAMDEYFAAKKLKRSHPNDPEVERILEKATADKEQLVREYVELKKKVEQITAQLQK